jgi:hypothetical protein
MKIANINQLNEGEYIFIVSEVFFSKSHSVIWGPTCIARINELSPEHGIRIEETSHAPAIYIAVESFNETGKLLEKTPFQLPCGHFVTRTLHVFGAANSADNFVSNFYKRES